MSKVSLLLSHETASSQRFFLPIFIIAMTALTGVTSSCGGGSMSGPSVPKFSGNTAVTVVLSSAANDQLTEFDLEFQGLTLTNQAGKTITLPIDQQPSEFIHLNGGIDLLATITIPQDIYTAATATIGGAQFTCVTATPPDSSSLGSLDVSTYAYGYTPSPQVTVTLPTPITVTGNTMALSLDLQVLQSATYSSCYPSGTYSITPTFNLTPLVIAAQPTNSANGKLTSIEAEITSINTDGTGFTMTVAEGLFGTRSFTVTANSATLFQGISNLSGLSSGIFVNMDGGLQPDGSLLATRIEVEDPSATNLVSGPLLQAAASEPVLFIYGRQEQGPLVSAGSVAFKFADSVFQVSGQLTNVSTLPFSAQFNASNLVAGQNVDITSPTLIFIGGDYTPANTITLIPQTIDAQVLSSSTSGSFTIYEVALASYNLFPTLAVQPDQASLLTSPSEMEVYVDSNAQLLNKQPLAAGSTLRFYGLVFNDNGTLRMDCAQVNDGVAESPQSSNAKNYLAHGEVTTTRHVSFGAPQVTTKVVTHPIQP